MVYNNVKGAVIMKLVVAIVSDNDATNVITNLIKAKFYVTKLATSGGFLKTGNTTLIVGVEKERVDEVLTVIEAYSKSRKEPMPLSTASEFGMFLGQTIEVPVGGATIFVVDVEQFKKI